MLRLDGVTLLDDNDETVLDGVSFAVRSGEIVGIAGVQGNGQTELVEVITGLARQNAGHLTFAGEDISHASVRDRHFRGMAHIPEDRHRMGMVDTFSIAENMALNSYYDEAYAAPMGSINWPRVHETAAAFCVDFDVRTPSVFLPGGSLSGGNQQKMVVARELERQTRLVVASQPTRGVDVGSIEYIHQRLVESRDEGDGVLIVSSELDEIMGLSDRILVMFEGRIVAEFDNTGGGRPQPGRARDGRGNGGEAAA
jgi:ABC-type uncharacterized transport system ATPase subunit